jgi:hypothetical protein
VHFRYYAQYNAYPHNGDQGWSVGAMANAPFADNTMAVRLMAFGRKAPGYVDDEQAGKKDINRAEQAGVRGAYLWQPD